MPTVGGGEFTITWDDKALQDSLRKWQKLNSRAVMRGVRAAGRKVKSAARSRAPVGTAPADPHPGVLKKWLL